ncbi:MAG: hypothetical protein JWQ62_397 [Lacunisphaera sp.]|nr:hypothetical protein [Lacunisphaera sp.]
MSRFRKIWRRGHQPREAWAALPANRGTNGPASIPIFAEAIA